MGSALPQLSVPAGGEGESSAQVGMGGAFGNRQGRGVRTDASAGGGASWGGTMQVSGACLSPGEELAVSGGCGDEAVGDVALTSRARRRCGRPPWTLWGGRSSPEKVDTQLVGVATSPIKNWALRGGGYICSLTVVAFAACCVRFVLVFLLLYSVDRELRTRFRTLRRKEGQKHCKVKCFHFRILLSSYKYEAFALGRLFSVTLRRKDLSIQ